METGGDYDINPITISETNEAETLPQRRGNLGEKGDTRERDSYIVVAQPGQNIKIVVSGDGPTPLADPYIELHDPEGILIAANDNYPGRGKEAVLSVTLPTRGIYGESFPVPSAYRILVNGIDKYGDIATQVMTTGSKGFKRIPDQGGYTIKVFTGELANQFPPPLITSIEPSTAFAGAEIKIVGNNFSDNANSNRVFFNNTEAIVTKATSTELSLRIPESLQPGVTFPVSVTVRGQQSNFVNFEVQQEDSPSPSIGVITPVSALPGSEIIIEGTDFGSDSNVVNVQFDGIMGEVLNVTPTAISVRVPGE